MALSIMDLGGRPGAATQAEYDAKIYTPTPRGVARMCWWRGGPREDHPFDFPDGWQLERKSATRRFTPPLSIFRKIPQF